MFSVHHPISRAGRARLVGSARRRSQCSRAQFCSKDLRVLNTCPGANHFFQLNLDVEIMSNSVLGLCGRFVIFVISTRASSQRQKSHQQNVCVQKLVVSHPYKSVITFGGCKQDFMLVAGQNIGTNATKDKATVKHLFAMDASKVGTHICHF